MKRQENRIAFQGGAYSLAITAVVLAIPAGYGVWILLTCLPTICRLL